MELCKLQTDKTRIQWVYKQRCLFNNYVEKPSSYDSLSADSQKFRTFVKERLTKDPCFSDKDGKGYVDQRPPTNPNIKVTPVYLKPSKNQESVCRSETLPWWLKRQKIPKPPCLFTENLENAEKKAPQVKRVCAEPEVPKKTRKHIVIDTWICVICGRTLYRGGHIYDLEEKIPYIKKQSELYHDGVAFRMGNAGSISVHKKCYRDYVETIRRIKKLRGSKSKLQNKSKLSTISTSSVASLVENTKCPSSSSTSSESEEEIQHIAARQRSRPMKYEYCIAPYKPPEVDLCKVKTYLRREKNAASIMGKFKAHGLVSDLWPNIRLLQLSGHFLHEYHDDNSAMNVLFRKMYSTTHLILVLIHFIAIIANLAMEADDVNILAANSITVLFFAHCITKFCYFGLRRKKFYRTLAVWDTQNSHPLFAESHARHRAIAITKSRRLLMITVIGTLLTVVGWTGSTFFGESTKQIPDPENNNETITVEIPRLMLRAWYPWDATNGSNYMFSFIYQLYWLIFTLFHANLVDLLFCSWLIFACEQLLHVKEIMKPLIDLSSSLDTYNPGSADLFKAASTIDDNMDSLFDTKEDRQINIRGIYSNMRDFGMNRNNAVSTINSVNGIGPNGLTKKHEMLVRSAIKYWVERHKHIVRYVGTIGDAYGLALLLHMLTSTITLTLLAYQATKIDGMDLYAMAVMGYLFYSLAQVFAFCIYGNQLIEESSSVMEAAYSCQWYDGSEEAKTFVQIVCQQCQKALSISGAKFFTVSLDLFASVLGAVVTYFMVLVQLK